MISKTTSFLPFYEGDDKRDNAPFAMQFSASNETTKNEKKTSCVADFFLKHDEEGIIQFLDSRRFSLAPILQEAVVDV